MLILGHECTLDVDCDMWVSLYKHKKHLKEAELLSCALHLIAFHIYMVRTNWTIIPNAPRSLLPLWNTCPDISPKLLKALMKPILDMPEVCAPPYCKMPWGNNAKTKKKPKNQPRISKRAMPGHDLSSGFLPVQGLTCDETELLYWAICTLNTVTSFWGQLNLALSTQGRRPLHNSIWTQMG